MSKKAGSNQVEEPAFLLIGKLGRSHGVHGEIEMQIITDFPERLKHGKKIYIGDAKDTLTLDTARSKGNVLLLSFEGIDTPEEVKKYTNFEIYVRSDEIPELSEGEYYYHELLGLSVVEENKVLGELTEILETGANDVFVVRTDQNKEILIPAIDDVILGIDLANSKVLVRLPEGLLNG